LMVSGVATFIQPKNWHYRQWFDSLTRNQLYFY
jgi:hypothetical protein